MQVLQTLTVINAPMVSTIINKKHPEWGTKKFNYNEQPLSNGKFVSSFGSGCNSAVLFEADYKDWYIKSWKS